MLVLLQIAGGVALILFGVRFLRKGLDRVFGARLADWMQRLARSRPRAFLAGVIVAGVMPSSTSITLLSVQTVRAGQMTAQQMLVVLLGANIGLTVMVQLVAFRVESYAPVLILIGMLLFHGSRSTAARGIGQITLSMGLVFLAVAVINATAEQAMAQSGPTGDIAQVIAIAERHPLLMVLVAALATLAIQSSTATIALVMGLQNGTISMPISLAVVIGANVGLACSGLLAGWMHGETRRLGVANLLLKAAVAVAAIAALPALADFLNHMPGSHSRQIANAHTLFNLCAAAVGLPLVGPLNRLVGLVTPELTNGAERPFGPRHLPDAPLDSARIALNQSMREILHVSEIVRGMLAELWVAFETADVQRTLAIRQRDDQVDLLDSEIKVFLIRLGAQSDEIANSREQLLHLSYLTELENIGDIVDKNLAEIVAKQVRLGTDFSPRMRTQMKDFHQKVCENLLIAETLFTTRDRVLAEQLWRHRDWLGRQSYTLREEHFARLNAGESVSLEATGAFIDFLGHLTRINNCVGHLAYAVLQDAAEHDRVG